MESINLEKGKQIQAYWDSFSQAYTKVAEPFTIQGTVTCASMVKAQNAKRVLEVACGPGKHSLLLASSFLRNNGSVLVSCDFSIEMVKGLKTNYESEEADFSKVPGNKFVVDTETDYISLKDNSTNELLNKCDLEGIVKS
mmetsp:Transcript_12940/g.21893  ORF Transcript_12940/g.21893 Transcript_12940/m.21893 type:complete len:140 (-) Transcript_12940:608-1027(-)